MEKVICDSCRNRRVCTNDSPVYGICENYSKGIDLEKHGLDKNQVKESERSESAETKFEYSYPGRPRIRVILLLFILSLNMFTLELQSIIDWIIFCLLFALMAFLFWFHVHNYIKSIVLNDNGIVINHAIRPKEFEWRQVEKYYIHYITSRRISSRNLCITTTDGVKHSYDITNVDFTDAEFWSRVNYLSTIAFTKGYGNIVEYDVDGENNEWANNMKKTIVGIIVVIVVFTFYYVLFM